MTRRAGDELQRALDLVVAVGLLAVLAMPLAAAALVSLVVQGRPVLHTSRRAGRHGRPFVLLKLRTMTDQRDATGALLPDEARLTRWGRVLRSTSIDELPQLWNVLRGEMSLVGPRPLPLAYLPRYTPVEARRHEVRPGLTGWAQVHGRNAVAWDERLALDVWYVDHRSLALDLRILGQTVGIVVRRAGIAAEGEATMGELRPETGDEGLAS
jgi:lipopolysaccharide/colanic/teichoic acid biosynthesis glycosyltransferase